MNVKYSSTIVILLVATAISAAEPNSSSDGEPGHLANSAREVVRGVDRSQSDLFYELLSESGPLQSGFTEQVTVPFAEEAHTARQSMIAGSRDGSSRIEDSQATPKKSDAQACVAEGQGGEQELEVAQRLRRPARVGTPAPQPSYLPHLQSLRASGAHGVEGAIVNDGDAHGEFSPLDPEHVTQPGMERLPPPLGVEGAPLVPGGMIHPGQPYSIGANYQMDPDDWMRQKIQSCSWNPDESPLCRWFRNQYRNRQLFGSGVGGGCGVDGCPAAGGQCGARPFGWALPGVGGISGGHCASCGKTTPCACRTPKWYGSAEALFLQRNNSSRDQPIVSNGLTGEPLISSGDFGFDNELGIRLSIVRKLGRRFGIEAGYFGLQEWGDSRTATADNALRLPGDIALTTSDFLDADSMRVDYDSTVNSAEMSGIFSAGRFELLGGFRYFELDEYLNINSQDLQSGTSDYSVDAENSLYGGQLGIRVDSRGEIAYLRCTTKAGVYGVNSEQRTFLADVGNASVLRDLETRGHNVAFLGEINLDTVIRLTRHCRLRAGYNVIWVEGIALAADQLDLTDSPTSGTGLDQTGGALFHGASAGVEVVW